MPKKFKYIRTTILGSLVDFPVQADSKKSIVYSVFPEYYIKLNVSWI